MAVPNSHTDNLSTSSSMDNNHMSNQAADSSHMAHSISPHLRRASILGPPAVATRLDNAVGSEQPPKLLRRDCDWTHSLGTAGFAAYAEPTASGWATGS